MGKITKQEKQDHKAAKVNGVKPAFTVRGDVKKAIKTLREGR